MAHTSWTPDPADPAGPDFRSAVGHALSTFLELQRPTLARVGDELAPVHRLATDLTAGGKRLRPAFCFWGRVAAGGVPDDVDPLVAAAASLDLLHVSALVHDDVMDASDLRRGMPAAHRQFEDLHRSSGWLGESDAFGRAGAILLGDLLVMWSAEMLQRAGLPADAVDTALPVLQAMRTEVTCGQFLDVVAQSHNPSEHGVELAIDEAQRVVEFKSARYTVQRPCQFGAALGGADEALQQALAAYGSPLGRAFQFRDDLLGIFGDPELTGKPAGDDLREGKRTLLVAYAHAQTTAAGRALLDARFGRSDLSDDEVIGLRAVITDSGAREQVETMINSQLDESLSALATAEVTDLGRTALTALAAAAVRRDF